MQTVWSEAYERTRALDTAWMRSFYGIYLTQLLGYDRIYVLSADNAPVFGFVPGDQSTSSDFASIGAGLTDLLQAVRDPKSKLPAANVVETDVTLGNGTVVRHRAVADVRAIHGRPATVVVSTIVPDRGYRADATAEPMLLVAVEDIDKRFTKQLGENFGFRDMEWAANGTPAGDVSEPVKSLNGAPVGVLAWRKVRPGLEFIRRVAPGLGIALSMLAALAFFLILWGNRQAKSILTSEAQATMAARTDPLTGLPNRVGLRQDLARLLDEAKAKKIDARRSLGRHRPIQGASTMRSGIPSATPCWSPPQSACVGRCRRAHCWGVPDGDCFVMLVPGIEADDAAALASDMLAATAGRVDVDGTRVFVTACGGLRHRAARRRYGR